ncbi:hypothetical protein ACLESO_32040 [Pyxidicoccus sp. 3LG]
MASSLALAGCGEAATDASVSAEPYMAATQALEDTSEGVATERRIIVYQLSPAALEDGSEGAANERRIIVYQTTSLQLYMVDKKGKTKLLAQRSGTPVLSPDGKEVAYARLPDTWSVGSPVVSAELHVLEGGSGKVDQLTRGYDDTEPVWTPDGGSLLFQSSKRTGMASLWKVRSNGRGLEQVTNEDCSASDPTYVPNPASSGTVQWAPNQRRIIVYSTTSLTNGDVRVIDFDQSLDVEAAYSLGQGYSPRWTENGTVVYSRKDSTGVVEVEVSVD